MNKKIKFVIVGFGNMGRDWVNILKGNSMVQIAGVVDVLDKSLSDAIKTLSLNEKSVGKNLRKIISETKADAVLNTSSPSSHSEIATIAIKMGCHVLGEKPMSLDLKEAKKLIKLSQNRKKIYMINQNYRWNPMAQAIKKFVSKGGLGNIHTVSINYSQNFNFKDTFRYSMDHPLLLDMAIHHFDLVRSVTGADFSKVYCIEYNTPGSRFKNGSSALAIFNADNNLVFNYQGSWGNLGGDTSFMGSWRISGEKGTIVWDGDSNPKIEFLDHRKIKSKKLKSVIIPQQDIFAYELNATLKKFILSVTNRALPETWCGDNIQTLKMVLGAIDSSKKSQPVNIPKLNIL